MVTYKAIALEDKEWINSIVEKSRTMSSEYPFISNFLWQDYMLLDLIDNKKFFSVFSNRFNAYLFPLIDNINDNYYERLVNVINLLKNDADKKGIDFKMYGLTEETKAQLNTLFPGKFEYVLIRDSSDYIYKIEELVNLKGKKFHNKKNLINRFKFNYPNWVYKPLDKSMFQECRDIDLNWFTNKGEDDEMLNYEINISELAFKYFDELDLFGGVIMINEKIAGFTIAYKINDMLIDNVIEKAIPNYNGLYNILQQQFLANLPKNYIYVNREEDLGLENLRKAKLLLHPYYLLDKYNAIWIN